MAKSELEILTELMEKGYRHIVQFTKNGENFGEPLAFKSADEVGPFMRENPKLIATKSGKLLDWINALRGEK